MYSLKTKKKVEKLTLHNVKLGNAYLRRKRLFVPKYARLPHFAFISYMKSFWDREFWFTPHGSLQKQKKMRGSCSFFSFKNSLVFIFFSLYFLFLLFIISLFVHTALVLPFGICVKFKATLYKTLNEIYPRSHFKIYHNGDIFYLKKSHADEIIYY